MTKKLSLFKSWLLLLVLMVGSSAAWADEVYYTLDGTITGGTNGYATESEITQNSMTWMVTGNTTMNPWRIGGKSLTNENRPVYSTTAMGSAISQVDLTVGTANLTVNSIKLIVASDAAFSNQIDEVSASYSASSTITFEPTTGTEWATGAYYKFVFNVTTSGSSNQYVQFSKAEFYYKPAASTATLESITLSGNYPTTFTEGATFSHEGMTVTATYDDNTTKDVTSKATFSAPDMSTIGTQEVTVSYSEGEVTKTATYNITVNAIPTHTVTWSVNGTTTSDTFKEGAAITFPANPDDIEGKTFVGWVATAISGTTNDAPNFVTSATMGTADITYYAVFATKTAGTATTTDDELTATLFAVSGTNSYDDWSGKTASSSAVYAGNSSTSSNNAIQLRSNYSNSGIVTTTSGGKVTKVVLDWDTDATAADRDVYVYGKNTAYGTAEDLYNNSKQGTLLGTLHNGTTELNITDDYEFIGIRSKSGALFLKSITITWTNGTPDTYSDYCTTVVADTHADAELAFSPDVVNFELGGTFVKPTLAAAAGFNGTVEYTSSNENVAQITDIETGDLVIVGEGTTIITATFAGDNTFKPSYASYTLNVTDNRIATTITQDNIVLDVSEVATLTQLNPVVKDANDNTVAYDNTGALPEVYFSLDNDADGIIGSLDGNGAITLNSVLGTATITARYNNFNENTTYKPSECTFTITVESVLSIADARTQATGTVVTKGVVTSCSGTTAYIQDATAAICVYGTALTVGDEIKVSGTLSTYKGLLEITSPNATVISSGNTVTPEVMTIEEINNSTNQGWLVKIENAIVSAIDSKNVTIAQGASSIVVRFNDTADITFSANEVITLTGNIGCFDAVQIANPTDVTVQQNTTPSIEVAQNSINVDAAGANGTIDVTYNNITNVSAEVKFFEADGTTAATYNWITANIDSENKVEYTVDANTGDARTAYMKVYESNEDVYSELITITQAKYEAPITPAVAGVGCFVKVTSTTDITDGNYLIVYEGDQDHVSVAFNGGLDKLDAVDDNIEVAIANNKIFASQKTVAAVFTIKPSAGTIQSASGRYIGSTSDANGMNESTETSYTNTISIDAEGNAEIVSSGGAYLRFNSASNQERFRYYKSSSYGNQKAIQLYKYDATATAEPVDITITAGYKTFCYADALDFSGEDGITVYTATVDNNDVVTFNVVTSKKVPAGEGVLLQGANKPYNIPVIAAADAFNENAFVGVTKDTKVDAGIFVLMNQNNKVGFYKTTKEFTVGAHTAYLPALVSPTRDFIGFGDDATTGIGNVNVNLNDNNVYNLQGQRVNKAQKGLYIVNGKKVVLK